MKNIFGTRGGGVIFFIRALLEEMLMSETADCSAVGALRGAWAPVAEWEFIVHACSQVFSDSWQPGVEVKVGGSLLV